MERGWIGLAALLLLAWACSEKRREVDWKRCAVGVGLQVALALVCVRVPLVQRFFLSINSVVEALGEATRAGTSFIFGYLGGGPLPFDTSNPGQTFILAFQALPLVLVVSALSSLLFYWRILPVVVKACSWVLEKAMGVGGALGLATAANVFVGMVEAPLFVRPYLHKMIRSELFAVMTGGMATVAGTVMVLYASILNSVVDHALGHILVASLVSAPAALVVARIMIPEGAERTGGDLVAPNEATSAMDAVTEGTREGINLLLNIVAMLIVLLALVHLVNLGLGALPLVGGEALSLERILGWLMGPVVWLMGVPWEESGTAGMLMGTKTVLNELIAYVELSKLPPGTFSEKSRVIMLYAMCGFANLGSVGIMLGGLCGMAPNRRAEIVSLGGKSLVAGTIATCMTGAIIGIIW
ncbi:MAG: nucleoside transporter C-terminal domain-containing protein [Myxococcota bacterium]|nr:nucleoside transporter C-terminal domain-containing protein [Myxococcota bacterium]